MFKNLDCIFFPKIKNLVYFFLTIKDIHSRQVYNLPPDTPKDSNFRHHSPLYHILGSKMPQAWH